jgi:hypothetical protein
VNSANSANSVSVDLVEMAVEMAAAMNLVDSGEVEV